MKDALGHGSNGNGLTFNKVIPARPGTQSDDAAARDALDYGGPKQAAAPIHDGMASGNQEASRALLNVLQMTQRPRDYGVDQTASYNQALRANQFGKRENVPQTPRVRAGRTW